MNEGACQRGREADWAKPAGRPRPKRSGLGRPAGPVEGEASRGEEGEGRPVGLVGPKAEWASKASRAESKKCIGKKDFRIKNWFFLN
jgi:hypothetical protein